MYLLGCTLWPKSTVEEENGCYCDQNNNCKGTEYSIGFNYDDGFDPKFPKTNLIRSCLQISNYRTVWSQHKITKHQKESGRIDTEFKDADLYPPFSDCKSDGKIDTCYSKVK